LNWKKLAIPLEGNGKNWKKSNLKFDKIWPYHQREIKNWNMPWKFEMKKLKIFIFEIWNEKIWKIEMKIAVWNLKKWPYHQREMKNLKWRNHIFRLCHRDKTSNNTLYHIYHLCIPPYIYHMCKLWWYTIYLSHQILSYWSISNLGIRWYDPP
jgi:hypothetical protein